MMWANAGRFRRGLRRAESPSSSESSSPESSSPESSSSASSSSNDSDSVSPVTCLQITRRCSLFGVEHVLAEVSQRPRADLSKARNVAEASDREEH